MRTDNTEHGVLPHPLLVFQEKEEGSAINNAQSQKPLTGLAGNDNGALVSRVRVQEAGGQDVTLHRAVLLADLHSERTNWATNFDNRHNHRPWTWGPRASHAGC
jgi:hypothetical protein